jgi:hypothetical protein
MNFLGREADSFPLEFPSGKEHLAVVVYYYCFIPAKKVMVGKGGRTRRLQRLIHVLFVPRPLPGVKDSSLVVSHQEPIILYFWQLRQIIDNRSSPCTTRARVSFLGDNGDFRARFEINKSREATCILEQ